VDLLSRLFLACFISAHLSLGVGATIDTIAPMQAGKDVFRQRSKCIQAANRYKI
jgi:hypothetical protein